MKPKQNKSKMKLKNNTKKRNATPNEIAKAIIIDRLEIAFYYQDNYDYNENYSDEFNAEIHKHMQKHYYAIIKKLNPNKENIEIYY